jgi:hypothetical protein
MSCVWLGVLAQKCSPCNFISAFLLPDRRPLRKLSAGKRVCARWQGALLRPPRSKVHAAGVAGRAWPWERLAEPGRRELKHLRGKPVAHLLFMCSNLPNTSIIYFTPFVAAESKAVCGALTVAENAKSQRERRFILSYVFLEKKQVFLMSSASPLLINLAFWCDWWIV